MRHLTIGFFILFMAFMLPVHTEAAIADSSATGFTVTFEKVVRVLPDSIYTYLFRDIGKWWSPDHTWSGKASNLSIVPRPGGCFCEKLENGGGVRHMTVVFADPGKMLRLEGGLGPLQMMAVNGSMTFTITPEGEAARLSLIYTVGGYFPGGGGKWAPLVDKVVGEQFGRLVGYTEGK